MGKNRIVKNDPFVCEKLFEAEQSSGLPLRIAFVGITRHADREGRFEWRPRAIKLDALPYDDLDFSAILDLLLAAGFLEKYDVAGRLYGRVVEFLRFTVPNGKEAASLLPPHPAADGHATAGPAAAAVSNASARDPEPEGDAIPREKKDKKEKKEESPTPASLLDDIYQICGLPRSQQVAYWERSCAEDHIAGWRNTHGIADQDILKVIRKNRITHTDPPKGPKAFDHAIAAFCAAKTTRTAPNIGQTTSSAQVAIDLGRFTTTAEQRQ